MYRLAILTWLITSALYPSPTCAADDRFETDVFTSGTGGYHTYRIPSLLVTPKGELLAICEGRKTGASDDGDIDLVMRRSADGGRTWGEQEVLYEEGGTRRVTIGNPCPVVDRSTGTIWLTFCRNNTDAFVTASTDDGRTWAVPRAITDAVKKPTWGWYATGPGVGIQLRGGLHPGRLVVPCDHGEEIDGRRVMSSHVIYSDDHGRSWHPGGTVDRHTDECQAVELSGGELLINMRNNWGRDGGRPDRGGLRAVARSRDGGETWTAPEFDATLIEPVCQASLIAVDGPDRAGEPLLLFSNPASKQARRNMTIRASRDGGKSWPVTVPIDPGPSAYSCLAALPDGRIGLLYERGGSARISFTAIAREALEVRPPPSGQPPPGRMPEHPHR
jgi:sialidase-1